VLRVVAMAAPADAACLDTHRAHKVEITGEAGGIRVALRSQISGPSVQPGPPYAITATADPTLIRVCGSAPGTAAVTATVTDQSGNPVEDGTEVSFNVVQFERGDAYPRLARTLNGVASTLVRTKAYRLGERYLHVYILARQESQQATQTLRIDLREGSASSVTITAPAAIAVNNQTGTLEAFATDCAGNPVQNGTLVTFTADALGAVSPTVTTTLDGFAWTTLASKCTADTSVVTATVDGVPAFTRVTIEPGPPERIYAQTEENRLPNCGGCTTAQASLYDACSNLVQDGTPVQFTPQYGYVTTSPALGYTRSGIVTATVTTIDKRLEIWPAAWEQVVIASPGATPGFVSLTILPGPVCSVDLTATPDSLPINGDVSFRDITGVARVLDCSGTPVTDNTPVRLETTLGIFRNSGQKYYNTLTNNGLATGTLTSQAEAGLVTLTAIVGVVTDTTSVRFLPDPPWTIEVTAVPYRIPADGRSSSQIFAGVKDFYANYVMEGVTLTFVTDYGYFYESGAVSYTTHTNAQGFCQARLVSSATPQTAQVRAIAYNDRQGYAYVFFDPAPVVRRAFMPIGVRGSAGPPAIANGGFEAGWNGWSHGGDLYGEIQGRVVRSGQRAVLLGDPGADCTHPPVGEAWVEQEFVVPSASLPRLALWYRIVTHDRNRELSERFDRFNVWLEGALVHRDANIAQPATCLAPPVDLGWKEFTYDLSAYRGRSVRLRIALSTPDDYYSTWVYVDDVEVTP